MTARRRAERWSSSGPCGANTGLALDALHAFEQAAPLLHDVSDNGGLAALHYNRGSLCRQLGLLEEAIRELRDARSLLQPRDPIDVWEGQVWSELLNAMAQFGDEDAIQREIDDWMSRLEQGSEDRIPISHSRRSITARGGAPARRYAIRPRRFLARRRACVSQRKAAHHARVPCDAP